jgi:hypothetical protein
MKTNKNGWYQILTLIVLLSLFISCHKTDSTPEIIADVIIDNTISGSPTLFESPVPIEYPNDLSQYQEDFDFENLEYLPVDSSTGLLIPMPWSDKAKTSFNEDIRYDIKKSDGWLLYQCSSSSKINVSVKTIILYNKYSGIIRYYYYLRAGVDQVKEYNIFMNTIYLLESYPPTSPLLNYSGQEIIDINNIVSSGTTIEPQPLSDSTWYAFEYELAFDKDIYSKRAESFGFGFNYAMIKKNILTLNGKPLTDLNTKIRFSEKPFGSGNSYRGNASLIFYSKKELKQQEGVLSSSDLSLLNQVYDQQSFNNLLNGSINYNSQGAIQWPSHIAIDIAPGGCGFPGGNENCVASGADNSGVGGFKPFYKKALGVFYLNSEPEVTYSKYINSDHPYNYTLEVSSVKYIFNPAVTEIADIKNIVQEVVATQTDGVFENFSRVKLYLGQKLSSNLPLIVQGVRVSFDVVPKDGSKTVHIVKTFKANIVPVD